MRRYEEDFNEEYERGYRAGRREALRELNESESMDSLANTIKVIVDKYKSKLESMVFDYSKGKINISQRSDFPNFKIFIRENELKPGKILMDADLIDVAGKGSNYALNTHITDTHSSAGAYANTCKDIIAYYEMVDKLLKAIKK